MTINNFFLTGSRCEQDEDVQSPIKQISSSSPHSANGIITRAEFYHELSGYVKRDEFDRLKSKYDRLKRKVRGCRNEEADDYDDVIKDYGPHCMYDATKRLMLHAYTQDEILAHTISGKRANSKVTTVKPKFTPSRFTKVKNALQKKFPESLNDPTLIHKRITSVQKRLKLDQLKDTET